jgi:hypothetical protein
VPGKLADHGWLIRRRRSSGGGCNVRVPFAGAHVRHLDRSQLGAEAANEIKQLRLQLAVAHKRPQDRMAIDCRRTELGLYFDTCMCRVRDVRASCSGACVSHLVHVRDRCVRRVGWRVRVACASRQARADCMSV